jgi:hypothetical protein
MNFGYPSDDCGTMGARHGRWLAGPIRLALASELGGHLDGAWWPHSVAVARELAELIDALREPVGEVTDIGVNWSPLDAVPDLDALSRSAPIPGHPARHQRMMTVTGSQGQVNLLVIPSRTTRPLAVMVLRQAAALPILPVHLDTPAYRTAGDIVRAARAESALRCQPATVSICGGDSTAAPA